jgi:hypothetical protein|tara:strand:- start:443 stop:556 length:114 start_codon:yes stop_codon:yes gene_type:complete
VFLKKEKSDVGQALNLRLEKNHIQKEVVEERKKIDNK